MISSNTSIDVMETGKHLKKLAQRSGYSVKDDEKVFLCGASLKDAGGRITSVLEDPDRMKYDSMITDLLKNNQLILK